MGGILNAIEISSRGLSVQRGKMNVVAENMANAETTETVEGGPYRRKRVVVTEEKPQPQFRTFLKQANGHLVRTHGAHRKGYGPPAARKEQPSTVRMREVAAPETSYKLINDPTHPDADEQGYVRMPDIDIIEEMVDMMAATRGYEANTVAIGAAKKMARNALDI